MDSGLDLESVLDYLHRNGFLEAESALRQEITAGKCLSFDHSELPDPPPPVRIPVAQGDSDAEESGSSTVEEFLSLGSASHSELVNPYAELSSSQVSEGSSSDRLSEFGTARDYRDFNWCAFRDGFQYGFSSVDKYVTDAGARENVDGLIDTSESDFPGMLRQSVKVREMDFEDPSISHGKNSVFAAYSDEMKSRALVEIGHFSCCNNSFTDHASIRQSMAWTSCHRICSPEKFAVTPSHESELQIHEVALDLPQKRTINNMENPDFQGDNMLTALSDSPLYGSGEGLKGNMCNRLDNESSEICSECKGTEKEKEDRDNSLVLQIYENLGDDLEIFDLRIIHRKNRTGFEEHKDLPIILNTIIAGRFYVVEQLGSAAFSKVIQAHDLYTGVDVCLKIVKNDKDFFDQSLDEIKLLKFVNRNDPADDNHLLRLYDYFYHQEHLFIVCELLRANLYEFQKYNIESGGELYFTLPRLQSIARQCLEALQFLHHLGIIHCDLKPENILIKSYSRCEIKVIDLGSSCFLSDNLCLYVQSRSYRAPEVILGLSYDDKIDIWSLGCILAELCSGEVLFPNESVLSILAGMVGILGRFDDDLLLRGRESYRYFTEGGDLYHKDEVNGSLELVALQRSSLKEHLQLQVSDDKFVHFLSELLQTNPARRPSAVEALRHPWLSQTCY